MHLNKDFNYAKVREQYQLSIRRKLAWDEQTEK
jgi:hypothetical protein